MSEALRALAREGGFRVVRSSCNTTGAELQSYRRPSML